LVLPAIALAEDEAPAEGEATPKSGTTTVPVPPASEKIVKDNIARDPAPGQPGQVARPAPLPVRDGNGGSVPP
jgi:hypothetical protein